MTRLACQPAPGRVSVLLGRAYVALGRVLLAQGKRDEARSAFRSGVERFQNTLGPDHAKARDAQRLLDQQTRPMPPPRILLVMPEHWLRALLRAELIERGYDVVGTPDLAAALLSRPVEMDRGPVRVIVIDQDLLAEPQSRLLDLLASRHPNARLVLLARAQLETPRGAQDKIVRRPALIGEIATAVEKALTESPPAAAPRT